MGMKGSGGPYNATAGECAPRLSEQNAEVIMAAHSNGHIVVVPGPYTTELYVAGYVHDGRGGITIEIDAEGRKKLRRLLREREG